MRLCTQTNAPRLRGRSVVQVIATMRAGVFVALLTGCGGSDRVTVAPPTQPPALPVPPSPSAPPTLTRTVVLSGLSNPWDIAVATDGAVFFTERCRGLSVRRTDGTVTRLFGIEGATLAAPDLFCEGQSGMHGVVLDPAFASNRQLYLFMASNLTSSPRTNRVVRLQLDAEYRVASARTDIVTDIAFKHVGNAHGGAGAHSGGRLRFGPDSVLYVATGDNHNATLPQHPTRLGGKVLRITRDGVAAPGNRAPAGFDARVFTYGHRNVQGIAFRPGSGQPFVAEHGPNHSDEVTALVAGGNAGWDPQNRPGLNCGDGYCGYAGNATTMPMTDVTRFPDALRATWSNNGASQGMGPCMFLSGTMWGSWNGRLAVGLLAGGRVDLIELNASGGVEGTVNAGLPSARYRALTLADDGALWVATDAGEIWRVVASSR